MKKENIRDLGGFIESETNLSHQGDCPKQGTNWWRIFLFVILFFNFIAGLGYIFKFVK